MADRLDYGRLGSEQRPYFLDDWRQRESDALIRRPLIDDGCEVLVSMLVEHQSTVDQALPLRLLVYAVFHWDREWKAWKEEPRGQPLQLIASDFAPVSQKH